ncbi:hypothetical protein Ahu01nite_013560 [Winogradskya humida]|uniref:F5/8 type C domain-containing protein n=1 Tax=Winogradskya humida TaxID=113566 RepID=A0ABQ3ZIB3_9ACTN|nr:hypothetical protein Ahu01nite_013560 [Actinoplanes humidus]
MPVFVRLSIGVRALVAAGAAVLLAVVIGVVVLLVTGGSDDAASGGGKCGTADVAKGKPVEASSSESDAMSPSYVTDGNPESRWGSAWGDPQTIQVDLGASMPICRVGIKWEKAYATAYDIQLSDDGQQWTAVYSTTTGAGGDVTAGVAGSGRYVRVLLRARATVYGYSIWDIQVNSGAGASTAPSLPPGATTEQLLSYMKPAEASSTRDTSQCTRCDASRVVDQDTATEWVTAEDKTGPAWVRVDLGAVADVRRVELVWGKAYAREYTLEGSWDGDNWTQLSTTDTGTGKVDDVPVTGQARFVRVSMKKGLSGGGYALWEFRIFGTGGAPIAPPGEAEVPSEPYSLVWGDDFDGASGSAPDPKKWVAEVGPGVTGELQYYTNNRNAALDGDGNLVIKAKREVTPGSKCPRDPVTRSTTCQYTSGRLNTNGLYSLTYGRVEARIKVSGTQGLWPAFWMLGADLYTGRATWPNSGEIDIMEHIGREPGISSSALHAAAYHGGDGIGGKYHTGGDLSDNFHTYAVDWRPDKIVFSVDGNAYFTADRAEVEKTRGPWVFDRPFVILLNNAVGGPFPGPPDSRTRLPQDMVVDYVHVYR